MNWNEAEYDYLIDILFHDDDCEIEYKWQALNELIKRSKRFNEYFEQLDRLTKEYEPNDKYGG